jgi:FtsH-binding integral membrane protein
VSPAAKAVVVLALVAIIASLFSALFFMYRDRGHGTRMVKALALRVALSVGLFLFLMLGFYFGLFGPPRG